jgi:hypothetical protein
MTTNKRAPRPRRRGDNIPTVADYAHYGEEAEAIWYAENKYDMEHADELLSDQDDNDIFDDDGDEEDAE